MHHGPKEYAVLTCSEPDACDALKVCETQGGFGWANHRHEVICGPEGAERFCEECGAQVGVGAEDGERPGIPWRRRVVYEDEPDWAAQPEKMLHTRALAEAVEAAGQPEPGTMTAAEFAEQFCDAAPGYVPGHWRVILEADEPQLVTPSGLRAAARRKLAELAWAAQPEKMADEVLAEARKEAAFLNHAGVYRCAYAMRSLIALCEGLLRRVPTEEAPAP